MKNENLCKRGRKVLRPSGGMYKRIAVFLLVFCMLTSNLPYGMAQEVYAADEMLTENVNLDGVVYKEIEPGKMQLVEWQKETKSTDDIVIPETITYDGKDYTVVSIGDSAFAYKEFNSITFPDTIESIGQEAFRSAFRYNVSELTLPPNLKEIGKYAFWNAWIYGELVIPDSVTFIGEQAFREMQISSVVISNPDIVYGSQVFAYNRKLTSIQLPEGMDSLGGAHFLWGCKNLEKIDMPKSITSIPGSALNGCEKLTEIQIPASVNQIGSSAFCGCTGVTEIVVPDGVTEIPIWTFRNCSENLCVTLPDSITFIHNGAFWDTKAEKEKYSQSVTVKCTSRAVAARMAGIGHKNILLNGEKYEQTAFNKGGYTYTVIDGENKYVQLDTWEGTRPTGEVAIPETVTWEGNEYTVKTIGENAFEWCSDMTKITLPDTVTGMGTRAFWNCKMLESINLPDGVTRIEQMTFYNCPLLTELTLPSNLQYIGPYAFDNCEGLQKIDIPGSCMIDTGAFNGCTGITEVTLREGITEIGSNMFCGCTGIKEILLPDSVKKIDGCAFQNCAGLEKIVLNQGLTEIGERIFIGCDKLTGTMVLPDSVTTIRQDAFADSSLSGVHVGSGLTVLESGAFPDTIRLTTNSPEVWKLLSKNTNRENAPVFVWLGTCDVPAGMHAYVEEDIVVTGSVTIGEGAVVTIMNDASLTIDNGGTIINNGTVEGEGAFTVNGTLTNNGTVEGTGIFTVNGTITGNGTLGEGMQMSLLLTEDMVADVEDAVYTAAPIEPEPEVSITFGARKIAFEKDIDFTYSYANNTNPGTAYITVTPKAGGKLAGQAVTTDFVIRRAGQATPTSCNLTFTENEDKQTFTATIERAEGAEYSFDGEIWTDENTKTDCQPNTEYTAYIRMKETDTHSVSEVLQKTQKSPKLSQNAPSSCNLTYTENEDKQTFTAMIERVEGAEYSFDGETWTDTNTKTDCQPNTEYTAYIRMKETDTHSASEVLQKTQKSPKLSQNAPSSCNLTYTENEDKQTFTATIERVEGAEYSFDGETWTDTNIKTDCQPNTEYTAYIRMKENDTHSVSEVLQKTLKTPELKGNTGNDGSTGKPDVSENKLSAPEILKLKSIAGKKGVSVQVTVKPVAGADHYEIYRISGKKTTLVKTTLSGKTGIQDEKPVRSAKYYAVAVSKDGSAKSAAGKAKAIKLSIGTKIKKVASASRGIKITWKKGKNVKKYVLYRSTKKNSGYMRVKTLGKKTLSYVDKKAKKGKKYYYKIVVLTASKSSLMSTASKRVKRR